MKLQFLITALLLTVITFGQIPSENVSGLKISSPQIVSEKDSVITVVYKNVLEKNKKPAYFLNGKLTDESILRTLNPNEIIGITVEKGTVEIANVTYYGKLYLVTKPTYKAKLLSLNDLKTKYTALKKSPTIFTLDGTVIQADYDTFFVDENFILKMIVEPYDNASEKITVTIIHLITKTEENIKKSNQIILRGKDVLAIE